jgi:hypothetical protein
MEWISFFEKRPKHGQKIFYYGEPIGVWYGEYRYVPEDLCSPHLILSLECAGVVDRMDAPWWQSYEGQAKPPKPEKDYPPDYPA